MASYAKRTCYGCGIILPQPQMARRTINVKAGSGNTGLDARNVLGAAVGHKGARRRVLSWMFNPSKRDYKRKKQVWLCPECD